MGEHENTQRIAEVSDVSIRLGRGEWLSEGVVE